MIKKRQRNGDEPMNVGFNQNVEYRGEVYHVQTEDGGEKNPVVSTVVFRQGVIVASRRTGYAGRLETGRAEEAVGRIMRDQHAAVIKDLKAGLFDGGASAEDP